MLLINLSFSSKFQREMKPLPNSKDVIVLRTDFTNDASWMKICKRIQTPDKQFGFLANIEFINDTIFKSYSMKDLLNDTIQQYKHSFIFIIDSTTISNSESPILCVNLNTDKGKHFRVIPSLLWGVENNLSLANLDFEDFTNSVDSNGIFRGFK